MSGGGGGGWQGQKIWTLEWVLRSSSQNIGRGCLKWVIGKWNPDIACLDLYKTFSERSEILLRVFRSCHPDFNIMVFTLLVRW